MEISRRTASVAVVLCMVATACSGAKKAAVAPKVRAGDSTGSASGGTSASTTGPGAYTGATTPAGAPVAGGSVAGGGARGPGAGGPGGRVAVGGTGGGGGGGPLLGPAAGGTGTAANTSTAGDPTLFTGGAISQGITRDQIVLCAHAALTYGPAFNATPDDFNVYYQAVNDAGGIYGRKITATYENDNYDPQTAVQAAEACKAKKPFVILGGIGFDQIPAVRNWAENNKELYLYHIATEKGSEGKQYSYTSQPSVEQVGQAFGEFAATRFAHKKIGILYRNSEFWQPGYDAFRAVAKARGLNVVLAVPVEKNQANYTQALVALRNAGAQVVWGWENTLALTEMVKQAKAQSYSPTWLAFPFNLTSQTLGDDAMTPPMVGLATWPGYSKGDYSGTFASYAADMKEFEAEYRKYRPNTDISGVAGDLLWLNWVGQKGLVDLFRACGPDCTRNHFVGLLAKGYRATVSPNCPVDFSGGRHNGSGGFVDLMETYRSPSGKVNWRSTGLCRTHDFS
ncbi:MAG: ABC transporter substrate-binding protein [Acidimicrobiales bacterium]